MSRLLNRDVVVKGNPRVYKALRDTMREVLTELRRIEAGEKADKELLALLATIIPNSCLWILTSIFKNASICTDF